MNLHRYFFYLASLLLLINTYDAVLAFFPPRRASASASGRSSSWSTSLLLWGYTLGCHACRHIVGGKLKHFSRNPLRYAMWNRISTAQRASTCSSPGRRW